MVSNLFDEAQDNPGHSPAHIRETFPWSPRSLGLIGCRTPPPWLSPARSWPILEQVNWVTVPHSRQRSSFLMRACMLSHFSHVQIFVTLWIVAHQAPWSMEFSRQEYWSGLPCLPLGDLPNPGIKPTSLFSPALSGRFFTTSALSYSPPIPNACHLTSVNVPITGCNFRSVSIFRTTQELPRDTPASPHRAQHRGGV